MRPDRFAVLDQVRRVREGIDPHRHAPFAQHTMRIPEHDFYALCKLYPDLISTDPDAKQAAWARLESSAFADPYRVGRVVRGVTKNGLLVK
jgi:hypothetical protein